MSKKRKPVRYLWLARSNYKGPSYEMYLHKPRLSGKYFCGHLMLIYTEKEWEANTPCHLRIKPGECVKITLPEIIRRKPTLTGGKDSD